MNFCVPPSDNENVFIPTKEPVFASLLVNRVQTLRLKNCTQSLAKSKTVYVLALQWEDMNENKCKVLFTFADKLNLIIHRNILQSFIVNLNTFAENGESIEADDSRQSSQLAIRDLCELDDDDCKCEEIHNSDDEYETAEDLDDVESELKRVKYQRKCDVRKTVLRKRSFKRCPNMSIERVINSEAPINEIHMQKPADNNEEWSLKRFLFRCIVPTKCQNGLFPKQSGV